MLIKLSSKEKAMLRAIKSGQTINLYNRPIQRAVLNLLSEKGLVKAIMTKGYDWGQLTDKGNLYLTENPKLRNPIDWVSIRSWMAILISFIALLISFLSYLK